MGKLGEEDYETAKERRRVYTNLESDLGERKANRLPCLRLGLGDNRRRTSGSRDVSFTSFNRIFYFSGSPALEWRLMRPKRVEDLAAFSVRDVERAAAAEKREEYFYAEGQW